MDEIKENNNNSDAQPQVPKAEPTHSMDSTNSPQASSGSSEQSCDEKLVACEKQRDEYLAGWQRARADFINYKKEESGRFEQMIRFANEDLLEDLVGVLDSFDLGLQALEKAGPVEKGVYMIRAKLDDVVKLRGLERLPVKVGDKFDPSLSESIVEMESDQPEGTIVEIIESGYKLHDKILRPARVKVSKGK